MLLIDHFKQHGQPFCKNLSNTFNWGNTALQSLLCYILEHKQLLGAMNMSTIIIEFTGKMYEYLRLVHLSVVLSHP